MAQVLGITPPPLRIHEYRRRSCSGDGISVTRDWSSVSRSLHCGGRFSCLFSDNRKQEQARKALESALGEKKPEFEKWSKEIKRREEAGGGGNSSGGGWFRWGGSGDDNFWQEAKQASLTILGLVAVYLVVTKGDAMLALVFNPLLTALRGIRTSFELLSSKITKKRAGSFTEERTAVPVSAKDSVTSKWRNA